MEVCNTKRSDLASCGCAATRGGWPGSESPPPPPGLRKILNEYFDWSVTDGSGNANYTPAPILTDANVASVAAILASRPPGSPLAVENVTPISNTTANAIFNNFKVSYVFADLESSVPP